MLSAAVTQLKATLSHFLSRVKAGEELVVTQRGRPIAKIIPIFRDPRIFPTQLQEMERRGLVRLGTGKIPKDFWRLPRPKDSSGSGVKAIIKERDSRR